MNLTGILCCCRSNTADDQYCGLATGRGLGGLEAAVPWCGLCAETAPACHGLVHRSRRAVMNGRNRGAVEAAAVQLSPFVSSHSGGVLASSETLACNPARWEEQDAVRLPVRCPHTNGQSPPSIWTYQFSRPPTSVFAAILIPHYRCAVSRLCPLSALRPFHHALRARDLSQLVAAHVLSQSSAPTDGRRLCIQSLRWINRPKSTYVVCFVAPSQTLSNLSRPPLPSVQPLPEGGPLAIRRAQWVLKLVMGSQHSSPKLTSRTGHQHQQHARS